MLPGGAASSWRNVRPTPALSPKEREKRRLRFGGADGVGRRMVCFVKVAQAVFVAATVKCIRSVTGHSLSPGERARVHRR